MIIGKVLAYICLIVCFAIYIHFEKLKSYREGVSDGMEHYSKMVEGALHHTNQWNKEAAEAGMNVTAHVESIKPFNNAEMEE